MGAGSKEIVTGYNYWGSFAIAFCHGPVQKLYSLRNGDTVIWEGPIEITAADGDGKVTLNTSIGEIDFYFGSGTQNPSDHLEGTEIDYGSGPEPVPIPAWRGVCYAVCRDLAFGGQVVPPTLMADLVTRTAGLTLTAHHIQDDAIIPEAIYQLLTNAVYGEGLSSAIIDVASFEAAAETLIDEGLAASVDIDQAESVREVIGRLLQVINGGLYWVEGKWRLVLERPSDEEDLVSIDESVLLEEPRPSNAQFEPTWNRTLISFRDRDNEWEETTEPWDDQANLQLVGQTVTRTFNFPWVTRRAVATQLAKRFGLKGGIPTIGWELIVKPHLASILPGQLLKLSYAKFGISNRVVRVKPRSIGASKSPTVKLTVVEEANRWSDDDYVPSNDTFSVPGILNEDGTGAFELTDAEPRLSWLPTDLKEGKADGVLVAINRPDGLTTGASVYWTWDPMSMNYKLLGVVQTFPAKATILTWHRIRGTNWLLRLELATATDYDWLQTLVEESPELYGVVGERLFKTVGTPKDQHQVISPWLKVVAGGIFTLLSGTQIEIEVSGGEFGTNDLSLEQLATDGNYPTLHIYFGRMVDFAIIPSNSMQFDRNAGNSLSDSGKVRHFKTTVRNHAGDQDLTDVTAVTFDRDNTAMCPSGTYSRDWGARAVTAYELLDVQGGLQAQGQSAPDYGLVEDIDEALGAILLGTETADQTLLAEHVDDVLGKMAGAAQLFYNV
jgi:hypothetical protein